MNIYQWRSEIAGFLCIHLRFGVSTESVGVEYLVQAWLQFDGDAVNDIRGDDSPG